MDCADTLFKFLDIFTKTETGDGLFKFFDIFTKIATIAVAWWVARCGHEIAKTINRSNINKNNVELFDRRMKLFVIPGRLLQRYYKEKKITDECLNEYALDILFAKILFDENIYKIMFEVMQTIAIINGIDFPDSPYDEDSKKLLAPMRANLSDKLMHFESRLLHACRPYFAEVQPHNSSTVP